MRWLRILFGGHAWSCFIFVYQIVTHDDNRSIMNRLQLSAILPHLEVFGSARRCPMLARLRGSGDTSSRSGSPPVAGRQPGCPPRPAYGPWDRLPTASHTTRYSRPSRRSWTRCGPCRRRAVWYCVLEGERGAANALAARGITLMANSGPLRERLARRSGRPVLDGISGIDLEVFRPDPSARTAGKLTVLA